NDTPVAKLDLSGKVTGKALATFNEAGDQNVFTASASGTPVFAVDRSGNLLVKAAGGLDTFSVGAGALNIGTTNQTGLAVGRSGATTSIAGSSLTLSTFNTNKGLLYTDA